MVMRLTTRFQIIAELSGPLKSPCHHTLKRSQGLPLFFAATFHSMAAYQACFKSQKQVLPRFFSCSLIFSESGLP